MAYGTTVKFTIRTRTNVKLSFVKFPTVKYMFYMDIYYVYIFIT